MAMIPTFKVSIEGSPLMILAGFATMAEMLLTWDVYLTDRKVDTNLDFDFTGEGNALLFPVRNDRGDVVALDYEACDRMLFDLAFDFAKGIDGRPVAFMEKARNAYGFRYDANSPNQYTRDFPVYETQIDPRGTIESLINEATEIVTDDLLTIEEKRDQLAELVTQGIEAIADTLDPRKAEVRIAGSHMWIDTRHETGAKAIGA